MQYSQLIKVVGGGVMGLCAAYVLKQKNPEALIVLSDTDEFPPRNASFIAGGMLAPYAEAEYIPAEFLNASLQGIAFWKKNILRFGRPVAFQQSGSLMLSHPEDRYILERFKDHIEKYGEYTELDRSGLLRLEPDLAQFFNYGLFLEAEAFINPEQAMAALYQELCHKTVEYSNVETGKNFDWVIDCRGYEAARDDPDLRGVKGETLIVRNTSFTLHRPVRLMHPRYPLYIVPRDDHIFMIGATSVESADKEISLRSVMELGSALYSLHPSFEEARILDARAGIRPAYPDNLPRIAVHNNIIRCNGLFRHGYLLAPVIAECVADYIQGKGNEFMHLFRRNQNDPDYQRREKGLHRAA